jgi:hypothetical protein
MYLVHEGGKKRFHEEKKITLGRKFGSRLWLQISVSPCVRTQLLSEMFL